MKRTFDWERNERAVAAIRERLAKPATIRQLNALNRTTRRLYDERIGALRELAEATKVFEVELSKLLGARGGAVTGAAKRRASSFGKRSGSKAGAAGIGDSKRRSVDYAALGRKGAEAKRQKREE